MFKLVVGCEIKEFESWESLQEFVTMRDLKWRRKRRSKTYTDLIYKVHTTQPFVVKFDEEGL